MLQGLPPVSKVTFLNSFIYVLKRWPVINSWLVIKGWNIGDSQRAPSLLSALTLPVTNNETHRGTFMVFDYYLFSPTTSLLRSWHTNFVLVIIRPSSFKHHRADCLPENIPMATRHSPDHVCVSNSCHKQPFFGQFKGENEYTRVCVCFFDGVLLGAQLFDTRLNTRPLLNIWYAGMHALRWVRIQWQHACPSIWALGEKKVKLFKSICKALSLESVHFQIAHSCSSSCIFTTTIILSE